MNQNIGHIYDSFLKFTDEYSDKYKDVFIRVSDYVDKYAAIKLVDASIRYPDQDKEITFSAFSPNSISISGKELSAISKLLDHSLSDKEVDVLVHLDIAGKLYTISYSSEGKYIYPKEAAKAIKKIDVRRWLNITFSTMISKKDISEDDVIFEIIYSLFSDNSPVKLSVPQTVSRYFDIALGKNISTSGITEESDDSINKKIELELLINNLESLRVEYENISSQLKEKKDKHKIVTSSNQSVESIDKNIEMLSADAIRLRDGISDKKDKISKIDIILPQIVDTLRNGDISELERKALINKRNDLDKVRSSYDDIINEASRALDTISAKIKVLESDKLSSGVAESESEDAIVADLHKLSARAELLNASMRDTSERISSIKSSLSTIAEKENDMKFVSQINFAETSDFLKRSYFLSADDQFVFNFMIFFSKCLLTNTKPVNTVQYVYNSILGF